jgi:uncharacterized protein (TIGR03083 family)
MSDDAAVSIDPWLAALRGSHQRLADVVTPLTGEQVEAPSYASEWTIAQVMSHIGSGAEIFSLVLDAGLSGSPSPQLEAFQAIWQVWDAKSPQDQARDALSADEAFLDQLDGLDADQVNKWRIEMFGGEQQLADLLRFRLGEHALHTWDVVVVHDASATVQQGAVDLLIDHIDQLVARSGKPPTEPLRVHVETADPTRLFRLHSSSDGVLLEIRGIDTPADDNASLRLPAEAFVRLVYGRLDPQHTPPLEADGIDLEVLRTTFPGF